MRTPLISKFTQNISAEFGVLGKKLGFVETQVFSQNDSDIGVNIRKDIGAKVDTQVVRNLNSILWLTGGARLCFITRA